MKLNEVTAVSALDGRYRAKVADLADFVSEYALIRYRVEVECCWYLHLASHPGIAELPAVDPAAQSQIRKIYQDFTPADAQAVKDLEATTNHDVKAVEYFVKDRVGSIAACKASTEFVHFACTSEDINNLAYALMLKELRERVITTRMQHLIVTLSELADATAGDAMLSRTHGQAASPTTLGKELANFSERLAACRQGLDSVKIRGKCNGAVGNFNAHLVAYPEVDWQALSYGFVESFGLTPNSHTTQIEPHDFIAEYLHAIIRFNQVLLDFNRDAWSYISIGYFDQRRVEGETGSSTMPHKVNPIDFENSEGNIGIANALLGHLASKLPVSRWQRDLSDSTALRNIGAAIGHCVVAIEAALKGISKLEVNRERLAADLDDCWEVLGEAVQTVMRKHALPEPYERLKAATRGQQLNAVLYAEVLEVLDLPAAAQAELEGLTPAKYVGLAEQLARTGR